MEVSGKIVCGKSREKRKARKYSRWQRSAPDAFLRRGSLRGCTGLSPLERGCGGLQTRPRPARPALRGCPRPHDADVRSCCSVRPGSRCPAPAAQLCPLYLQLPEAQQNISPSICRLHFFPLVSQAYLPQNICPPLLLLVCHIAIVLIAAER